MTRWISHLLGIDVSIEPLTELHEAKLTWYVGLDSEATGLATGSGMVRLSTRKRQAACSALFRLHLCRRYGGGRQCRAANRCI